MHSTARQRQWVPGLVLYTWNKVNYLIGDGQTGGRSLRLAVMQPAGINGAEHSWAEGVARERSQTQTVSRG